MKRSVLIAATLLTAVVLFAGSALRAAAQTDSCSLYMGYYQDYYKHKDLDRAVVNWRKAYQLCPRNFRQNIYIQGSTLMKNEIAKSVKAKKIDVARAQYDSLLTLQEERLQYFPTAKKGGVVVDNKIEVLNNKGTYIVQYIGLKGNDNQYMYDNLMAIVDELGSNAKDNIVVNALTSAVALYQDGKMDADNVINTYDKLAEVVAGMTAEDEAGAEEIAKLKTAVDQIFADSKVASCDNLIAIFSPRFNADPENLSLAKHIVKLMNSADNCASNDLYLNAVTTMYKMEPSAASAYGLYRLNSARGNIADAARYLEEAIASEDSDAAMDAQYNYEMAAFCYKNGMRGKAYEAARKAVEMDGGYAGKAYLIIGNLWASATCSDTVDKWARYWAATDYYQKARSADASVADEASASISSVSRYYPEASEAFMYDLTKGQSYTVSCGGMTAATTVRVQ
ncbi:MAG: hypothetical protein J5669_02150 [Bacteroidales bacterium]|nr:hypothetical protein [Bacteroidales bacterium]